MGFIGGWSVVRPEWMEASAIAFERIYPEDDAGQDARLRKSHDKRPNPK